ncbi:helix-turn-helix transcriptional regulator [Nonomuraea jiangxiensis]|uniref:Helix-turn-helix domain-containing protein n=1 Tax=Nonomuraea jiangxiensis TaxID=633440 RepID=A0A1G9B1I6_9ACTN|nr:helix-turn-helix transcriptional regulator [Nonomuraea jiangxiensis]SDK33456.1 Helix-turn-helix domain-containing protein [Nonomuraea jiangxiensis]
MDSGKLLGDFLRTRREALTSVRFSRGPETAEVAMLAGISTAAYTRLENGTEHRPSERVLGSLARVLELDPAAKEQMWALARPLLLCHRPEDSAGEPVSPHLRRLIDGWTDTPALLCDRLMNVRAANCLGTALLDGLEHADNLFRLVFLDPAAPEFFQEWYHIAGAATDSLHAVPAGTDDPELAALIGELSGQSRDFRRLWAGHDLVTDAHRFKRMRHPEIGDVTLICDVFDVHRLPGYQLIVFQAEPGSPSEHALALLGSLAVTTI